MRRAVQRALAAAFVASIGAPALAADAAAVERGKAIFTKVGVPACVVCHALKDAGAEGAIGPSLDELKPDAARVAAAVRNGIGQMPAYGDALRDQDIAAVAAYVERASRAAR